MSPQTSISGKSFALQRHVNDHAAANENVVQALEESFYINNCLRSLSTAAAATRLVDKIRNLLETGEFEIRQWASNDSSVVSHLPAEAKSQTTDLWLLEKLRPTRTGSGTEVALPF